MKEPQEVCNDQAKEASTPFIIHANVTYANSKNNNFEEYEFVKSVADDLKISPKKIKKISDKDIKIGDMILAYNRNKKKYGWIKISDMYDSPTDDDIKVLADDITNTNIKNCVVTVINKEDDYVYKQIFK